MPLTDIDPDKIRLFGLSNRTIRFTQVKVGAFGSCSFYVQTHFGDSAEESTTSSTSSMKGGNSGNNGSDLNKGNILKPTFNILMEEGHKAFEVYHANLEVLFLSRCEVTRHKTILKDTTLIVFSKPEIIPEVRPDTSPSRSDNQFMIDFVLETSKKIWMNCCVG
jgi:hypothetical protein